MRQYTPGISTRTATALIVACFMIASTIILLVPSGVSAQSDDITVGPGGDFSTIQAAIDSQSTSDGDVIHVWAGDYNENIVLGKSLTIIGNGSSETEICGTGSGSVITVMADRVTISAITVSGSGQLGNDAGILFISVHNCSVDNSTITGNRYGIYLSGTAGSAIINNNFINNTYQAFDDGTNIWSRLAPVGGNYWDDAEVPDGADEILDAPQIIMGGANRDRKPWSEPSGWETYDVEQGLEVDSTKLMLLGMAVVYAILGILTFTTYMTGVLVSRYLKGKTCESPDEGEAVAAIVAAIKAGE